MCPAQRPEGEAPQKNKEAPLKAEPDRAAAQKQREQAEAQRALEFVKKQIADCEKEIQGIQDRKAAAKEVEMGSYLDKRKELLEKQLDLLKQGQTALEANDFNQAKTLRDQVQTLMAEWSSYGEKAARIEAQRATWTARLADEPNAEVKTAWEELNQTFDAILKKAGEKKTIDSDLRNLEIKQRETAGKLEKLYRDVQRQKTMPKQKEREKTEPEKPRTAPPGTEKGEVDKAAPKTTPAPAVW